MHGRWQVTHYMWHMTYIKKNYGYFFVSIFFGIVATIFKRQEILCNYYAGLLSWYLFYLFSMGKSHPILGSRSFSLKFDIFRGSLLSTFQYNGDWPLDSKKTIVRQAHFPKCPLYALSLMNGVLIICPFSAQCTVHSIQCTAHSAQ